MQFSVVRLVKGQTLFGFFSNLFESREDCGGIKYLTLHGFGLYAAVTWGVFR